MILKRVEDSLVFTKGKFSGKKVRDVDDKGYLKWAYENAVLDLPDKDFYEFEDILKEKKVEPFDK